MGHIKRKSADIFVPFIWAAALTLSACSGSGTEYPFATKSVSQPSLVGSSSGSLSVVANLPPPEHARPGNPDVLFENDLLMVDIFDVNELDKEVRVDSDGTIKLPLIGSMKAAGRTVQELEKTIAARYAERYLQNPQVDIFVKESTARMISMDGEFLRPGTFKASSQSTLLRLVTEAGGLREIADGEKVFIFRKYKDRTQVAQYSITAIRKGQKADPQLYPRDVVVAFQSKSKVAFKNLKEALGVASSAGGVVAPL